MWLAVDAHHVDAAHGHSDSGNNPASDVRNADALSV